MAKKVLFQFIVVLTSFFVFSNVYAETCTTKELNTLKQLATNIKFSYELHDEESIDGSYYFDISVTNFNDRFYIIDSDGQDFRYVEELNINGTRVLRSILENKRLKFTIYASDATNCNGSEILTKEISVPYFNPYSLRDECIGIEEFSLCQRYYGGYIASEDYFLGQIELYKNNQLQEKDGNDGTWIDYVITFISNHLLIIIPVVVILIGILVVVVVRVVKNKKKVKIKI